MSSGTLAVPVTPTSMPLTRLFALGPVPCVCSMTAYQFPLVDMYAKWHSRALAAEKQKANIIAEEINM